MPRRKRGGGGGGGGGAAGEGSAPAAAGGGGEPSTGASGGSGGERGSGRGGERGGRGGGRERGGERGGRGGTRGGGDRGGRGRGGDRGRERGGRGGTRGGERGGRGGTRGGRDYHGQAPAPSEEASQQVAPPQQQQQTPPLGSAWGQPRAPPAPAPAPVQQALSVTTGGEEEEEVPPSTSTTTEPRQEGPSAHVPDSAVTNLAPRPPAPNQRLGSSIQLACNHFVFRLVAGEIYQYAVEFDPDIQSKRARTQLIQNAKDKIGNFAFDGAVMFLQKKVPDMDWDDELRNGCVVNTKITFTNTLQAGTNQVALQFYNILFQKALRALDLKRIGRQHFDPTRSVSVPQHKVELWPGYFTSINPADAGMTLVVDVTHKILRTDTVLDYLYDLVDRGGKFKEIADEQLVGKIVLTRYNNCTYRIDGVDWSQTPTSTFTKRTGEDMSYQKYYAVNYNKSIRDLQQPLLIHRRSRRGQEDDIIYLIPELCSMTGISDQMRADFRVMRDIATHTRVFPDTRMTKVSDFVKAVNANQPTQAEFKQWGITLEPNMLNIQARVLPPETIIFADKQQKASAESADWSNMIKASRLIEPIPLMQWILVVPARNQRTADEFIPTFQQVAKQVGMRVERPQVIVLNDDRTHSYTDALKQKLTPAIQCVICILSNSKKDRYDAIKQILCLEKPIPSQCVIAKTLEKKQTVMSVCNKIMLQVNCKLGGQLWHVKIPVQATMVIGIDVCHDTSRNGRKSVAGFCASTNPSFTKFYSRVTFQAKGQEIIPGLKPLFKDALKAFYTANKTLPHRIIVFRDGVGDGQLNAVVEKEVPQLNETFEEVGGGYAPKMAVVVVKKRIRTRLFQKVGNSVKNPLPGTLVDSGCVSDWYDFFLVSQSVRQGTVSPTHYHVVYDTTDLNPDQMQSLTYKMCFLYYNWPGTVSVPSPCQYAHKIAFLVGQSIHKSPHPNLANKLYFL
ncbi:Piwi-like protein 1 [Balamuthia mandrillaris]